MNAKKWLEDQPHKWISVNSIPCVIFWSVWNQIEKSGIELKDDQFRKSVNWEWSNWDPDYKKPKAKKPMSILSMRANKKYKLIKGLSHRDLKENIHVADLINGGYYALTTEGNVISVKVLRNHYYEEK